MSLEKIVNVTEAVINFIPKQASKVGGFVGGKKHGKVGKYGGLLVGYTVTVAAAAAIPYVGGAAMYAVLFGSPVLGGYKKVKDRRNNKKKSSPVSGLYEKIKSYVDKND